MLAYKRQQGPFAHLPDCVEFRRTRVRPVESRGVDDSFLFLEIGVNHVFDPEDVLDDSVQNKIRDLFTWTLRQQSRQWGQKPVYIQDLSL